MIDTKNLPKLAKVKGTFWGKRRGGRVTVVTDYPEHQSLHRIIAEAGEDEHVIFLDGDSLNCTEENLRGGRLVGK